MGDSLELPGSRRGKTIWSVLSQGPLGGLSWELRPLSAQLSLLQEASLDSDLSSLGRSRPFFQACRRFGCAEGGTSRGEGRVGKWWVNEEVNLLSFPGQNELGQAASHPVLESPLEGAWGALGRSRSAGLGAEAPEG